MSISNLRNLPRTLAFARRFFGDAPPRRTFARKPPLGECIANVTSRVRSPRAAAIWEKVDAFRALRKHNATRETASAIRRARVA